MQKLLCGRRTAAQNIRQAAASRAHGSADSVAADDARSSLMMKACTSCSRTLYCSSDDKPWWACAPADGAGDHHAYTDAGTFVTVDSDLDDGCAAWVKTA